MRDTLFLLCQACSLTSLTLPCARRYEMNFWSPMAGPNAPLPQVLEGIKQYGQLGAAPSALVIALPWCDSSAQSPGAAFRRH